MISAPEPITKQHDLSAFNCGEEVLDVWLRKRAISNHEQGASKTYVTCEKKRVIGFYSLATGVVSLDKAAGSIKRNMPDPIPMMLLGRLAVDQSYQGKGIGRALLRDAILRTLQAAEIVGIRGIFVHAISDEAKRFYESSGFHPSHIQPQMLMISLHEATPLFTAK